MNSLREKFCIQVCKGVRVGNITSFGLQVTNLTPVLRLGKHVVAIVLDPVSNDNRSRCFGLK